MMAISNILHFFISHFLKIHSIQCALLCCHDNHIGSGNVLQYFPKSLSDKVHRDQNIIIDKPLLFKTPPPLSLTYIYNGLGGIPIV